MICNDSLENEKFIRLNNEDYFRLLSAKIVLDVLNKSIKIVKNNNLVKCDSAVDLDLIDFTINENKRKCNAWEIDFKNNVKPLKIQDNSFFINSRLNFSNCIRSRKYLNKKRWFEFFFYY